MALFHSRTIAAFLVAVASSSSSSSTCVAFAPPSSHSSRHATMRTYVATGVPTTNVIGDALDGVLSGLSGGGKKNDDDDDEDGRRRRTGAIIDLDGIALSGLRGKALSLTNSDFPDSYAVRSVIPADCFEPDTAISLGCLAVSVLGTGLCTSFGFGMLSVLDPSNVLTLPFWITYSGITGTVAMGLWVLAHECGHGAFSKNKGLQDAVGYVLHSLFLVPYYSWQRSHAVHHRYTNHMELGETHVPENSNTDSSSSKMYDSLELRRTIMGKFGDDDGIKVWGIFQAVLHLIIGWPAYLLIGATGGPDRGMTNHYYPYPLSDPKQPKRELFPGNWKEKVYQSDIGVAFVASSALMWAACNGIPEMMAIYGGPLIVVNAWLVLYTW